jgi:hypothetical protein
MHDSETRRHGWLVANVPETSPQPARPLAEAVACLRETRVVFVVCQRDLQAPQRSLHLDVLVEPGEFEVALAAIRRPGFREMHGPRDATTRHFLTYENDRFFTISVHPRFEAGGVEFLDAGRALSRRDPQGPWPRLCAEDRFLQLLLSLGLRGSMPGETERLELLGLRREGLDPERLAAQTQSLGLRRLIESRLADLDSLLRDRHRWSRFRLRLGWALLRQPGNLGIAWRTWKRGSLGFRRRPVVLAVMGPPGVGKSALLDALEEQLDSTPLAPGRVSMSCWAGGRVWTRICTGLAPVEPDYGRLWRGRRGGAPALTEGEWRYLREFQPGRARLLTGRLRQSVQRALFGMLLQIRLGARFLRGIRACRRPLVLADGWIGDWQTRLDDGGPWSVAQRPPWLLRRLPVPDGILYRSASYAFAASRMPHLQREQFENVDLGMRRLLRPLRPLEFMGDEPPQEVARTFLRRYWAHVLERHNHRS